jgi:hypothetical protein
MKSNQTTHSSLVLTTPALLSLFGPSSGVPNPDDSNPPGPWGPVIRRAEERVRTVLEPQPLPWREVFGPVPDPWRAAFAQALAQEVIDRVTLMQQVSDALSQAGSSHGIIIIGGMLSDFTDGCGTGRIRQGHPPPPLHHNDDGRLSPFQLVLMAAQFNQSANETANEGLRQEFSKAGEQLLEIGIGRLQPSAQAVGS